MSLRVPLYLLDLIAFSLLAGVFEARADPSYGQSNDISSRLIESGEGRLPSSASLSLQLPAGVRRAGRVDRPQSLVSRRAQIDAAMADLFAGELRLQAGGIQHDEAIHEAGIANELPARARLDWRSQRAWAGFLLEASLTMPRGGDEGPGARLRGDLDQAARPDKGGTSPAPPLVQPVVGPRQSEPAEPEAALHRATFDVSDIAYRHAPGTAKRSPRDSGAPSEVFEDVAAQLRGTVFIDNDADGLPGAGDTRLEGEGVTLTALDTGEVTTHRSASFGQYVFEDVAPGQYILSVDIGWERIETSLHVPPGGRFQRVDIALSQQLFRPPDRGPSHKRQFAMLE